MPRRMINSSIFLNEKFGQLDDKGRILFIGCFSNADDDGRLKASPAYLKALIFPYDNDKTTELIKELRDLCVNLGLVHLYSQNGTEYLYCVGWEEHQVIRKDRYHPSVLPAPNSMMPTTTQPKDNQLVTTEQPDGNHVVTTPQPNIIEYNISKDNIKKGQKLNKFPPEYINLRKQVFSELYKRRGYQSRKPPAEALAISQMLDEKFTIEDILRAYDLIKEQPFYQDKPLSMMKVRNDIHEVLKHGTHKQGAGKLPTKYTEPDELRHDIKTDAW